LTVAFAGTRFLVDNAAPLRDCCADHRPVDVAQAPGRPDAMHKNVQYLAQAQGVFAMGALFRRTSEPLSPFFGKGDNYPLE